MKARRKPTMAMVYADERRIEVALEKEKLAFWAALEGCPPHGIGCADWIAQHASAAQQEAYERARTVRLAAEQTALDRGTFYRTVSGMLALVDWRPGR